MRRKAFTLIELLVVIFIIGILVTMLLPELAMIRLLAQSAACQANLSSMGKSIMAYQEQSGGMPVFKKEPDTDEDVNNAPDETTTTDYKLGDKDAPADELTWEVLGDQAMQNVWLLVMGKNVSEDIFRCPGDDIAGTRGDDAKKYGWTTPEQYSYGIQWPYPYDAAGNRNKAPLGQANTAMMADMAPEEVVYGDSVGVDADNNIDPSNHTKLGTNVLLSSGGVKAYKKTDNSRAGTGGDDIYTAGPRDAGKAGYMPGSVDAGEDDTYESDEDTSIALSGRGAAAEAPEP